MCREEEIELEKQIKIYHKNINDIFSKCGYREFYCNIDEGVFEYFINDMDDCLKILSFVSITISRRAYGHGQYLYNHCFENSYDFEKNIDDMIVFKELILPKFL